MVYQITNINVLSVTENRLLTVLSLITDSSSPSASHVGLYTTTFQHGHTNWPNVETHRSDLAANCRKIGSMSVLSSSFWWIWQTATEFSRLSVIEDPKPRLHSSDNDSKSGGHNTFASLSIPKVGDASPVSPQDLRLWQIYNKIK